MIIHKSFYMPIILIIGGIIIALGVGALVFMSPATPDTTATPETEVNVRVEEVDAMNEMEISTDSDDDMSNDTDAMVSPDEVMPNSAAETTGGTSFTTTTTYLTPARTEHAVGVTLTLAGGVVSDAAVTFDNRPLGQYSNDNQARFADAYKAQVIGKPLDTISLSRVGGASLTSRAFNEAVVQIAADAAAGTAL